MAKWIQYSAKDTATVEGFVNLDNVDTVTPTSDGTTWYLRVELGGSSYTIATGSGTVTDAMAAFAHFLSGDYILMGA